MNYRTMLVIGVSILVVQGNALAARPAKKRVAPRSSSAPIEVRSSAAAARPAAEFPESDPEQVRYDHAKAKAKADPEVKALKARADQATDDATARATSEAYNRSLFRKMKQLDRSISDRADLVQAAILRKIHESSLQ